MRNQFPGICYRCGGHVAAREGHFERITQQTRQPGETGRWRMQHADCAIAYRGTPRTAEVLPRPSEQRRASA